MPASTEPPWSTAKVYATLRERYKLPEYALITEVPDATGFGKTRSADAIVMSCWPSRGLDLTGIEVKVSRYDWTRELRNPAKAERICAYCDFWIVVTGTKGIVADGELPPTWGLMEPKGDKLVFTKEPPRLTPVPVDRPFLAALLRRAAEDMGSRDVFKEEKTKAVKKAYDEGKEAERSSASYELRRLRDDKEHTKLMLDRIARETGFNLNTQWGDDMVFIAAIKMIKAVGLAEIAGRIDVDERYAKDTLAAIARWREGQAATASSEQTVDDSE